MCAKKKVRMLREIRSPQHTGAILIRGKQRWKIVRKVGDKYLVDITNV